MATTTDTNRDVNSISHSKDNAVETVGNYRVNLNAPSMSTQTILQEEYMGAHLNFRIVSGGPTIGAAYLTVIDLPSAFFTHKSHQPYSVRYFHNLERADFVATLKIPTTQFHQGVLCMFYSPVPIPNSNDVSVMVRNLPHVFINLNEQTHGSLTVPYLATTRMKRTFDDDIGHIYVMLWNSFFAADGATTELDGTVGLAMKNAVMAVRHARPDIQSDDGDEINYLQRLNEEPYWMKHSGEWKFTRVGPDHCPFHTATLTSGSYKAEGSGSTRRAAKNEACQKIIKEWSNNPANKKPNYARVVGDEITVRFAIPIDKNTSSAAKDKAIADINSAMEALTVSHKFVPVRQNQDQSDESPSTGTAAEDEVAIDVNTDQSPVGISGWIKGKNSLNELIMRADLSGYGVFKYSPGTQHYGRLVFRSLPGPVHRAILDLFAFRSGSLTHQIIFTQDAINNHILAAFVYPDMDSYTAEDGRIFCHQSPSTGAIYAQSVSLNPTFYWNPRDEMVKTINVPQVGHRPMYRNKGEYRNGSQSLYTAEHGAAIVNVWEHANVDKPEGHDLPVTVLTRPGHDFQVYFVLPPPIWVWMGAADTNFPNTEATRPYLKLGTTRRSPVDQSDYEHFVQDNKDRGIDVTGNSDYRQFVKDNADRDINVLAERAKIYPQATGEGSGEAVKTFLEKNPDLKQPDHWNFNPIAPLLGRSSGSGTYDDVLKLGKKAADAYVTKGGSVGASIRGISKNIDRTGGPPPAPRAPPYSPPSYQDATRRPDTPRPSFISDFAKKKRHPDRHYKHKHPRAAFQALLNGGREPDEEFMRGFMYGELDAAQKVRADAYHQLKRTKPQVQSTEPFRNRNQAETHAFSEAYSTGPDHITNPNPDVFDSNPFHGDLLTLYKTPGRLSTTSWLTNRPRGDILIMQEVHPMAEYLAGVTGSNEKMFVPTNLSHFGRFYSHWRGGLQYTLEVIATKFHQGQLYCCFQPLQIGTPSTPPTIEQAFNLNGVTLSITDANRVSIPVHYISDMDYLANQGPNNSTGLFLVYVLNPLTAAPNVRPEVEVNLDIAAQDDFEYAYPVALHQSWAHRDSWGSAQRRPWEWSNIGNVGNPTAFDENSLDDNVILKPDIGSPPPLEPTEQLLSRLPVPVRREFFEGAHPPRRYPQLQSADDPPPMDFLVLLEGVVKQAAKDGAIIRHHTPSTTTQVTWDSIKKRLIYKVLNVFTRHPQGKKSLLDCGDIESNPGPKDEAESTGLYQKLFQGIFGMIKLALGTSKEGILSIVHWFREKPSQLLERLKDSALRSLLFQAKSATITKIMDILPPVMKVFKIMTSLLWLTRKAHLMLTGKYEWTDILSDFLLLFSTDIPSNALEYVMDIPTIQNQAGEETTPFHDICTYFSSALTAIFFGGCGHYKAEHSRTTMGLVSTQLISNGVRSLHRALTITFQTFIGFFINGANRDSIKEADLKLKSMEPLVEYYCEEYSRLSAAGAFDPSYFTKAPPNVAEIFRFFTGCNNLVRELEPVLKNGSKHARWIGFCKDVKDEFKRVIRMARGTIRRPEPVGIYIAGPSGQGKSFLATTLIPEHVLSRLGYIHSRDQAANNVYCMPNDPEQQYFDGYYAQPYCVYDDLGASREGKDYLKMLNLISTASAPVNMAELEDKGQYFTSLFVCGTSNTLNPKSTALTNVDAIKRRFPVAVAVNAAKGYHLADGNLDMEKLLSEVADCTTSGQELAVYNRAFLVDKLDLATGRSEGKTTISGTINDIVELSKKKMRLLNKAARNTSHLRVAPDVDAMPISTPSFTVGRTLLGFPDTHRPQDQADQEPLDPAADHGESFVVLDNPESFSIPDKYTAAMGISSYFSAAEVEKRERARQRRHVKRREKGERSDSDEKNADGSLTYEQAVKLDQKIAQLEHASDSTYESANDSESFTYDRHSSALKTAQAALDRFEKEFGSTSFASYERISLEQVAAPSLLTDQKPVTDLKAGPKPSELAKKVEELRKDEPDAAVLDLTGTVEPSTLSVFELDQQEAWDRIKGKLPSTRTRLRKHDSKDIEKELASLRDPKSLVPKIKAQQAEVKETLAEIRKIERDLKTKLNSSGIDSRDFITAPPTGAHHSWDLKRESSDDDLGRGIPCDPSIINLRKYHGQKPRVVKGESSSDDEVYFDTSGTPINYRVMDSLCNEIRNCFAQFQDREFTFTKLQSRLIKAFKADDSWCLFTVEQALITVSDCNRWKFTTPLSCAGDILRRIRDPNPSVRAGAVYIALRLVCSWRHLQFLKSYHEELYTLGRGAIGQFRNFRKYKTADSGGFSPYTTCDGTPFPCTEIDHHKHGFTMALMNTWEYDFRHTHLPPFWKGLRCIAEVADEVHADSPLLIVLSFLLQILCTTLFIWLLVAIFRVIISFFFRHDVEEQSYQQGFQPKARVAKIRVAKVTDQGRDTNEDQVDPRPVRAVRNTLQVARRIIKGYTDNTVDVKYKHIGFALAVDDQHIITNKHYLTSFETGSDVYLQCPDPREDSDEVSWFPLTSLCYTPLNGKFLFGEQPVDAILVRLPFRLCGVRKLDASFVTDAQMEDIFLGRARIVKFGLSIASDKDDQEVVFQDVSITDSNTPSNDTGSVNLKCLTPTARGMCGIPYFFKDRILGIHANYDFQLKTAGCALITKEALSTARGCLDKSEGTVIHVDYTPARTSPEVQLHSDQLEKQKVPYKGYYCHGQLLDSSGELAPRGNVPKNTDFTVNPLRNTDLWDDGHQPSAKSSKILINRAQKYDFKEGIVPQPPSQPALTLWKEYVTKAMADIPREEAPFILDDDQVLNGIKGFIQPIRRDTSPGAWKTSHKGKSFYLDVIRTPEGKTFTWSSGARNESHHLFGDSFLNYTERLEAEYRQAKRSLPTYWTTSLKDELRPTEKVKLGKTRVFECASMDTTYLTKKYFGHFGGWYRSHPGPILSSAIGIDKETDWSTLWKHLAQGKRSKGIDVDFSEWDGSCPPDTHEAFLWFVEQYYKDTSTQEERNARASIIHDLRFSQEIILGHVFQTQKGNKSGTWLTDIFNSVVNQYLWFTAFCDIYSETHKGELPSLDAWVEFATLFVYGDDAIFTAADHVFQWFTGERVKNYFLRRGFRATTSDKKELTNAIRPIHLLTFLKSGFVPLGETVLAPMPVEIAYRELNWIRKERYDDLTVRKEMIGQAVRFMAHHGKKEYDVLCQQVVSEVDHQEDLVSSILAPFQSWGAFLREIWAKQQEHALGSSFDLFDLHELRAHLNSCPSFIPQRRAIAWDEE